MPSPFLAASSQQEGDKVELRSPTGEGHCSPPALWWTEGEAAVADPGPCLPPHGDLHVHSSCFVSFCTKSCESRRRSLQPHCQEAARLCSRRQPLIPSATGWVPGPLRSLWLDKKEMISVLLGEIRIPHTRVYLCVVRGCAMRPASYKHLLLDLRSAMMEENGSSSVQDLGKTKGASREKEGDNMKV